MKPETAPKRPIKKYKLTGSPERVPRTARSSAKLKTLISHVISTSDVGPCATLIVDLVPPLARLLRSEIAPAMGFGVSLAQYNLLSALVSRREMNNNELADWLGVSLPVATRQVDNLVSMELVVRIREDGDRRQVRLTLTQKGRAIHQQVHQGVTRGLFSKLQDLGVQDRKTLEKGLEILGVLIGTLNENAK